MKQKMEAQSMEISSEEYAELVRRRAKKSPMAKDCFRAFLTGGGICTLGQLLLEGFEALGLPQEQAAFFVSVTLIVLSALLTGLGVYDRLAQYGGAGTLVPITGFANAVVSPALEFRSEGRIMGTGTRLFSVAGPVLVYGIFAAFVYGLLVWAIL